MYLEVAFNDPNKKVQNLYIYKEILKTSEVIQTTTYTTIDGYRYGFNGMEKDDEAKGLGNSYTTEFRQYDSRLGRWLSIDPLFQNFPWQSPYVAFDNNPILLVDPLGLAAENGDDSEKNQPEELDEVVIKGKKMNWFERCVSKIKRAIGIGYTTSGESKKQAKGTEFLGNMSMSNHFGNGPSLGKEGKGVYYTDKDNPYYEEWEKEREQHKALEGFITSYAAASISAPFIVTTLATAGTFGLAADLSLKTFALKAGASAFVQGVVNEGEINTVGVLADGVLGFGSSAIVGSSINLTFNIETKKFGKLNTLGNDISINQFLINSTISITFGAKCDFLSKQLGNAGINSFSTELISSPLYQFSSNGISKFYEKK